MKISLHRNTNARWTKERINHIRQHKLAYYSNEELSDLMLKDKEIRLNSGNPDLLIDEENGRLYEIRDQQERHVGDVTFTYEDYNEWEISILVFDDYSKNGYSYDAIKDAAKLAKEDGCRLIRARIRSTNSSPQKITNILEKCNFQKMLDNSHILQLQ